MARGPTPASFPRLHAIVDVEVSLAASWTPADLARAYFDGGATFLQIRAKHLPAREFLALCEAVVRLGEEYRARTIVNDRVDLARLSRAAGVHVGQQDVPPSAAREILGPEAIVGFSTHTRKQIDSALREAVSYIAVGPIFETHTKSTGYHAVGLELVQAAAASSDRPIVAIGGITLERAPDVISAGAAAVAVIGDLLHGGHPQARVAAYRAVLEQRL